MKQPRNKIKFVIEMTLECKRQCWATQARRRKNNYDPELECLECLLAEYIEGYPAKDFDEPLGELKIERVELNGVDDE